MMFRPGFPTLLMWLLLFQTWQIGAAAKGPRQARITLFVAEAECPACAYSVMNSLRGLDGVTGLSEGVAVEVWVNVTYDPGKIAIPQLSRSVWKAYPLHGTPYQAYLKLRVPDYDREDNAQFVNAILARWQPRIKATLVNRKEGRFILKLPVPKQRSSKGEEGWRPEELLEAIRTARPKGPLLRAQLVSEN